MTEIYYGSLLRLLKSQVISLDFGPDSYRDWIWNLVPIVIGIVIFDF